MLSRVSKSYLTTRTLYTTARLARPFPTLSLKEQEPAPPKQGRANEIIEAVLYGSKKTREEENQTHSKVLARGKYVHELQGKLLLAYLVTCISLVPTVHNVKPDKVNEYTELV